jgi:hypothetical protein
MYRIKLQPLKRIFAGTCFPFGKKFERASDLPRPAMFKNQIGPASQKPYLITNTSERAMTHRVVIALSKTGFEIQIENPSSFYEF